MKNSCAWMALLLPIGCVDAHDVWLGADPPRAKPGDAVHLGLTVGERGNVERVAFDPPRVERLWVTWSDGASDIDVVAPQDEIDLRVHAKGTYSVGYVSRPATSELGSDKFDDYLREEHLEQISEQRRTARRPSAPASAKLVREHYSRSLKTLIGVGDDALMDCPLGLPLELSLVRASPSHLVVRATFNGEPIAGLWVDRGDAQAASVEGHSTDSKGLVSFARWEGDWILRATHMQASDEKDVDFRSWWATTVFRWDDAGATDCVRGRQEHIRRNR